MCARVAVLRCSILFIMIKKQPSRVAIVGANWPAYERYCPTWSGMQSGLTALGIENRLFTCRPALDTDALTAYSPDLVVYGLLDMVRTYQTRMQIRTALPKAKIVMWYGDLRSPEHTGGQSAANMSEIDMMFVSNDWQSDYYKRAWCVPDCRFLPLGAALSNPAYDKSFDFDFVFIGGQITGTGFLDRARTIWYLKENGLKTLDGPVARPLMRAKIMKHMPTIYRSSKVVLDWSHFTDIPGYTSNRYWNITAAGGFALTKRFPGCEDFYPTGTRVYFDTAHEALELRDYYLSHPDERETIRAAGYAHAIHHTYEERFATMFSMLYGAQN